MGVACETRSMGMAHEARSMGIACETRSMGIACEARGFNGQGHLWLGKEGGGWGFFQKCTDICQIKNEIVRSKI